MPIAVHSISRIGRRCSDSLLILVVVAAGGCGTPSAPEYETSRPVCPVAPLPTEVWLPGKVVWVDLVTADLSDPDALADRDITLTVETGQDVGGVTCVTEETGNRTVDQVWVPTQGDLTLTVRPGETEADAKADLILSDVSLSEQGGSAGSSLIDRLEMSNVSVGSF